MRRLRFEPHFHRNKKGSPSFLQWRCKLLLCSLDQKENKKTQNEAMSHEDKSTMQQKNTVYKFTKITNSHR